MPQDAKQLQLHPQEFIYKSPSQKDCACNTFIYEPANIEEAQLGNLYLLGKIENIPGSQKKTGPFRAKKKYKDFEFFLNQLVSVIKKEFYSNPKRETLEAFEAGLNRANSYLANFAEKGKTDWMRSLHLVCAAFSGNTLHISQTGNILVHLLREEELNDIGKKLFSDSESQPLKTFLNIASGNIEEGDKIIFSTGNILDIISLIDLKHLLTYSPPQIAGTLQRMTRSGTNCHGLACLIIEVGKEGFPSYEKSLPRSLFTPQLAEDSREEIYPLEKDGRFPEDALISKKELEITEPEKESPEEKNIPPEPVRPTHPKRQKTEKPDPLDLKEIIGEHIISREDSKKDAEKEIPKESQESVEESEYHRTPDLPRTELALMRGLSPEKTLSRWKEPIKKFLPRLTQNTKCLWEKLQNSTDRMTRNLKIFKSTKITALTVLIIVLLIMVPIYAIKKGEQGKKFEEIDGLLTRGWQLQKEIETALIYQNKDQARALLQQAGVLIAEVSEGLNKLSEKRREAVLEEMKKLEAVIENEHNSLNGTVKIETPNTIADFSNNPFDFTPLGIAGLGRYLYIYEAGSGSLYKIDSEKNTPPLFFFLSRAGFKYATTTEKAIVYLSNDNKIHFYDGEGNHDIYRIDFSVTDQEIKDFGNYLNNIYFLDIKNKDISKYTKEENSDVYKGGSWLKETPEKDLENAVWFAVDGYIYVLKSNGTISKYLRGEKISELNPKIDPPLSAVKIYTRSDLKNLYLLDSENKRVVILDKKGEVIKQYINDDFGNLKDIWIGKDGKTIFLLCEMKIYKLDIQ